MRRIRTLLLGVAGLFLFGCASPRIAGPATPTAGPHEAVGQLVRCEAGHPLWRDPGTGAAFVRTETEAAFGCCEEEEEEPWCCHRHELAAVLGYATERGGGGAVLGLDYGYKLSERWTLGGFAEAVLGDVDAGAAGVTLTYFIVKERWWVQFGPGFEYEFGDGDAEEDEDGFRTKFLLRFGTGAHFALPKEWFLSPAVYYDLLNPFGDRGEAEPVVIFALSVGKEF